MVISHPPAFAALERRFSHGICHLPTKRAPPHSHFFPDLLFQHTQTSLCSRLDSRPTSTSQQQPSSLTHTHTHTHTHTSSQPIHITKLNRNHTAHFNTMPADISQMTEAELKRFAACWLNSDLTVRFSSCLLLLHPPPFFFPLPRLTSPRACA